jgi:hypothetical protein
LDVELAGLFDLQKNSFEIKNLPEWVLISENQSITAIHLMIFCKQVKIWMLVVSIKIALLEVI